MALLLAKQGIAVQVVESTSGLDTQPRATHYAAPAVDELVRAGVYKDVQEKGFQPAGASWRKLDGTVLGALDNTILGDGPERIVCLPLDKLGQILHDHLKKQSTARIEWRHKVVDIGQDASKAWVEVETPEGQKRLEADYIVGCDGANSQIRRSLFGQSFPGWTWDEQIVATNVCSILHPILVSS